MLIGRASHIFIESLEIGMKSKFHFASVNIGSDITVYVSTICFVWKR